MNVLPFDWTSRSRTGSPAAARRRTAIALVVIAPLAALCGCGGEGERPPLVPVNGIVTLDGQPVDGLRVIFEPDDGRPATGTTDERGAFELTTFESEDGAVPGRHRIRVVDPVEAPIDAEPHEIPAGRVTAKYADTASSELERTVDPDGENRFEIRLQR